MKQRRFVEIVYGARTWKARRRCVARLAFGQLGNTPRFVVANINPAERDATELYDVLYCQHDEVEPHQGESWEPVGLRMNRLPGSAWVRR